MYDYKRFYINKSNVMCSSAVRGAWLGRSKLQVRMYICMNVPYVSTVCTCCPSSLTATAVHRLQHRPPTKHLCSGVKYTMEHINS